jgi:hypothetical protein
MRSWNRNANPRTRELRPRSASIERRRSTFACSASVFASVCVPTDAGAATKPSDLVTSAKAARSLERGFPPAASESRPHLADREQ